MHGIIIPKYLNNVLASKHSLSITVNCHLHIYRIAVTILRSVGPSGDREREIVRPIYCTSYLDARYCSLLAAEFCENIIN